MLAVNALLLDFDGTACLQDVSELLLDAFGEPGWDRFDDAVDRGEMGLREAGDHQVAMLRGARDEMLGSRSNTPSSRPPSRRSSNGSRSDACR
jgi:2-hydroxy-3-keto-5-methylthiopentenyl-1-phosphate phosphatase